MTCHIQAAVVTELAFLLVVFMACLVPAIGLAHNRHWDR